MAKALVRSGADIKSKAGQWSYLHIAFAAQSPDLFKALMEEEVIITSNEQTLSILADFAGFGFYQSMLNLK